MSIKGIKNIVSLPKKKLLILQDDSLYLQKIDN